MRERVALRDEMARCERHQSMGEQHLPVLDRDEVAERERCRRAVLKLHLITRLKERGHALRRDAHPQGAFCVEKRSSEMRRGVTLQMSDAGSRMSDVG